MRATLLKMIGAPSLVDQVRSKLQRLRIASTERRIRQVEDFLGHEQATHAEQMLWLRTELQRLRELRAMQAGEAHQYTSGALQ